MVLHVSVSGEESRVLDDSDDPLGAAPRYDIVVDFAPAHVN